MFELPGYQQGSSRANGAEWGAPAEDWDTEILLAAVRLPELCMVKPNLLRYVQGTNMVCSGLQDKGLSREYSWLNSASGPRRVRW